MNYNFSGKVSSLKPSAIREILKFTADPSVIPFAAGNPAAEAFPTEEIAAISKTILSDNPIGALQYSLTEGYPPLRDWIRRHLDKQNILGKDDDVVITSGAQQAIELSCKMLCDEGDTVICEAPSFIGSLNAFKSYNVNLVGVPVLSDGICVDSLEKTLLANPNTKMIYLIPNFQNPSGITMSLEKRKAVYELASRFDVIIVEDDPYGALRFAGEDVPPIKSLDTEGRVIYCGSFSKILSPGMRVGYVCANSIPLQKIVVCKQVSDVHSNIWAQMVCERYFTIHDYDNHIENLRGIYRRKSKLMLDNLKWELPTSISFTEPEGGLFIWATLPDNIDMMAFCKNAVKKKVAVVPGVAFMVSEDVATSCFRLNYSTPTDAQIVDGVKILAYVAKSML